MKLYVPYGFPGSGKGTTVKKILAHSIAGPRIADTLVLGDVFRAISELDPHGTFAQIMAMGDLVPDDMTNPFVINFLRKVPKGFVDTHQE